MRWPFRIPPIFPLPALGAVLFLWATVPCSAIALEDDGTSSSVLHSTRWSATAYGHRAAGTVCWLSGEDGSMRVEIRNARSGIGVVSLGPLVSRTGEGWTLILGPGETGTLNAWGREWQPVSGGVGQVVRLVVSALDVYPGPQPEFLFAVPTGAGHRLRGIPRPEFLSGPAAENQGDRWRYQLDPIDLEVSSARPPKGFRNRMTDRGRGTGGRGEILDLAWIPDTEGEFPGLEITSSRRPGTLSLDPVQGEPVKSPDPEVFLPLWPLSEFYEFR